MKIHGINVNVTAIAEGVYEMFDENMVAATAFGMLPAERMDMVERFLGEKVEDLAKDECIRRFGYCPTADVAKADLKRDFVRDAMHQICVAIYHEAAAQGKMVV